MSGNSTDDLILSSEPLAYRQIKFYCFVVIEVPSLMTALFILYRFARNRSFRSHINNHGIVGLIIISLLDTASELPITIDYLRKGYVAIRSYNFCIFWVWYNFSLQTTNLTLMSWISLERHILIFHSGWLNSRSGKLKWHYVPLLISVTYIPVFYFACVVLYSCQNFFDYSSLLCGPICYNSVTWLSTYDWTTNMLTPSLLIPFASLALLLRVLVQAKKMRRSINWRSTRKLTLQLTAIAMLYLLFWFPLALVSLIRIYFIPTFIDDITFYYLYYTPYLVQLLMPFVCLACLPEIWPRKVRVAQVSVMTQQRTGNTVNH